MHGLGNYKAMKSDPELPFSELIDRNASQSLKSSYRAFVVAASAACQVFDDALEAGRVKAELEVQAAVAAAAKAASQREEDAALLREGGDEAEEIIRKMPETQVENAFEFDGTDSHFVTLRRLHSKVREAVTSKAGEILSLDTVPEEFNEGGIGRPRTEVSAGRPRGQVLFMPDARLLDHRLLQILAAVEDSEPVLEQAERNEWSGDSDTAISCELRTKTLSKFFGKRLNAMLSEYSGIGLSGAQCGTTHRTLNDGTDFSYGSASLPLSQVAYGTDAPRFLRALGVPMNVTRFAVSALVYSDKQWIDQFLSLEHQKFYEKNENDDRDSTDKMSAWSDGKAKDGPKLPLAAASLVPEAFRSDPKVRAAICLGALIYGFPCSTYSGAAISKDVLRLIGLEEKEVPCFDKERFRSSIATFCPEIEFPDATSIAEYVEMFLLPHCIRLLMYGNGPTTRDARGSQGKFETALGISLHSVPSTDAPCPLPDPCVDVQFHSLESLGAANAILRRTQLLRSSQYLCSSVDISAHEIDTASRSNLLALVKNLPVWWCPWVHDTGLLVNAASSGILAVLKDRSHNGVFSESAIAIFLKGSLKSQPLHFMGHLSTPNLLDSWIRFEAQKFPTALQIERRLAVLCSKATSSSKDPENRFVVLPMFDHGGWPRD